MNLSSDKDLTEEEECILKEVAASLYIGDQSNYSWFRSSCWCMHRDSWYRHGGLHPQYFDRSGLNSHSNQTASLLAFFILALLRYPEVQKRAQSELDAVVGRDRLPEYEDKEALPYINAICQELLRWRMVAPLGKSDIRGKGRVNLPLFNVGVPHAAMEDDVYEGLFIPKGMIAQWSFLDRPNIDL